MYVEKGKNQFQRSTNIGKNRLSSVNYIRY